MKKLFKNKGYCISRSLIDIKSLNEINNKVFKELKNPKSLIKALNFKFYNKFDSKYPAVRQKKYFLNELDYKKGYNFFSKITNSVQIDDPLIKFKILNNFIFSKRILKKLRYIFSDNDFYFLYGVLRVHFKNKLPNVDTNFFHLDKSYDKKERDQNIIKFSIPLTLNNKKKYNTSEFNIITVSKKKLNQDQIKNIDYSTKKEIPPSLKKKIFNPKLKSGDVIFFDPINFFHNANKPKKTRIVFYGVVGRKSNYIAKKSKIIKIPLKVYNDFSNDVKKFTSLLKKI